MLVRNITGSDASDADVIMDAGEDASDASDAAPDATVTAPVTLYGSGFGADAGKTIYARLGPFSSNIASAVIGPDGTFVLEFPPFVFALFDSIYFDTYVDEDNNADCNAIVDDAAGRLINLEEVGDGTYEASFDRSSLNPPLFGCNGL